MASRTQTIGAMQRALTLLKGLGAVSRSTKLGAIGARVATLFRALDAMAAALPPDPPDPLLAEVERFVDALHRVDKHWPACGDGPAEKLLELAAQRLRRIAAQLR
ncbi:MAG: hypothetical protein FJ265_14185 [Planctomycetes bacterium]|nr:hypothetical protein [Planctomycetota bacterium]